MKKETSVRMYLCIALPILFVDIVVILLDILPDWWYTGWCWHLYSVETGKAICLWTAVVMFILVCAVGIYAWKKDAL